MFLCTLPNSKSIKFRLWGIRIKQCGSIWFWYWEAVTLSHCYTSYSALLFRICVWLHHFFIVPFCRYWIWSSLFNVDLYGLLQRFSCSSSLQLVIIDLYRLQWYSLSVFMTFYNLQNSVKLTTLDLKIFPGHAPDPRRCRAFVALFVPPVFSPWCRHCMPLDQV